MHHPTDTSRTTEHPAAPFTETLPRDNGPDWPSTPAKIFPSIPGHHEGLDTLALLTDTGPVFHIGPAVLDAEQTRALIAHLNAILDAATSSDPR